MIKEIIIATMLTIAGVTAIPAMAQEVDRQEQIAIKLADARERLELTEEQVPQVESILTASGEQRRAVLEEFGVGNDGSKLSFRQKRQLRKAMQNVQKQTRNSLSEVLTDGQMDEFEEMQDELRAELRKKLEQRRN